MPRYEVNDRGPDHAKWFSAVVHVAGAAQGAGEGRSKKQAEQAAARAAWHTLTTPPADGGGEATSNGDSYVAESTVEAETT